MFQGAKEFNQPIGEWNTGRVTNMRRMLDGASAFDQPLQAWHTSLVVDMSGMFDGTHYIIQKRNNAT